MRFVPWSAARCRTGARRHARRRTVGDGPRAQPSRHARRSLVGDRACRCNLDTMLSPPRPIPPCRPARRSARSDETSFVTPGDTVAIVFGATNTSIRTLIDLDGLKASPYALEGRAVAEPAAAQQLRRAEERCPSPAVSARRASRSARWSGSTTYVHLHACRSARRWSCRPASMRRHIRQRAAGRCATHRPAADRRTGRRHHRDNASRRHRVAAAGRRRHGWRPAAAAGRPAPSSRRKPGTGRAGRDRAAQPTPPTQPLQGSTPPPAPRPAPAAIRCPRSRPDSPFIWPVDGKVMPFGPPRQSRDDDIDIAAPVGAR